MKVGMLFPDYGSQSVGMIKELYDHSRIVQEYFEEASSCLNSNFVKLCFAASDAELSRIENAYCAIFLASVSIAAFLKEQGIVADIVAGYGIGEFSAVTIAGGLSFPDGLYFLNKYAHFYQDLLTTISVGMFKVEGVKSLKMRRLCQLASDNQQAAYVAAYNGNQEYLIAGHPPILDMIKVAVQEQGGTMSPDRVERGLHSILMDEVVLQLKKYLTKIDFKDLKIPLIASVDGTIVEKGDLVRRRIVRQLYSPILWNKVMEFVSSWDIIIEIGPNNTLSGLLKKAHPHKVFFTINKIADVSKLQLYIQNNGQAIGALHNES